MDALTIADTVGGCTPDAVQHVVKKVIDRLKKPVEIHCHQDFVVKAKSFEKRDLLTEEEFREIVELVLQKVRVPEALT
jgi:hypothetical protein